jgi:hypothetical protein
MIKKLVSRGDMPEASWTIDSCPKCGGDLEEFINMCGMELGCPRCKWNTLDNYVKGEDDELSVDNG